jgi:hypothetical protein
MQPSQNTISQDIKTLADWVYEQFNPTDPIEVQNILDKPYHFKYCVGETIETPDQVSRKVVDRQYEEITFEPGETKILMGAAAYIFVCGIAPQYVFQISGADATGDIQQLVDAAALAIIGKVGYSRHAEVAAAPRNAGTPTLQRTPVNEPSAPVGHNPNVVADDEGDLQNTTDDNDDSEDAFENLNDDPVTTGFNVGDDVYQVTRSGKGLKNGEPITAEELEDARAEDAKRKA